MIEPHSWNIKTQKTWKMNTWFNHVWNHQSCDDRGPGRDDRRRAREDAQMDQAVLWSKRLPLIFLGRQVRTNTPQQEKHLAILRLTDQVQSFNHLFTLLFVIVKKRSEAHTVPWYFQLNGVVPRSKKDLRRVLFHLAAPLLHGLLSTNLVGGSGEATVLNTSHVNAERKDLSVQYLRGW